MKKYIILSIALIGAFLSCKKSWLEIVPFGKQLLLTTEDYDKAMNDVSLYNYGYVGGWTDVQLMGDELAAEGAYVSNRGSADYSSRFFQWRDSIYTELTVVPFILANHLNQSFQWNIIINGVMNATGGTEQQKRGIRAEALATRAWSNWSMVQYYCKPYVASTAATDLGFPRLSQPDLSIKSYSRGTVQESYDFIIKDLTDALADIPQRNFPTRWSKPAVEGFLGKVYLFMGRYNDALPMLKAALADVAANGQTQLYDYNVTLTPGGSFTPIDVNTGPVNGPGNMQNDLKESVVFKVFRSGPYYTSNSGNDGMVLTPQAQALYGASDLRLKLYTNRNKDNTPNAGGRIRKYGVNFTRWGLQLPDLILLSAEAKARTNDLAGAVADVETLRKNRMPAADATVPSAIAGNQNALIKFIIDERIREFAGEGYRWFDMRRLSVDPLYAGITFTHTWYNADGTTTIYTLRQPDRLTLKLPRNIVESNPDMPNNP